MIICFRYQVTRHNPKKGMLVCNSFEFMLFMLKNSKILGRLSRYFNPMVYRILFEEKQCKTAIVGHLGMSNFVYNNKLSVWRSKFLANS